MTKDWWLRHPRAMVVMSVVVPLSFVGIDVPVYVRAHSLLGRAGWALAIAGGAVVGSAFTLTMRWAGRRSVRGRVVAFGCALLATVWAHVWTHPDPDRHGGGWGRARSAPELLLLAFADVMVLAAGAWAVVVSVRLARGRRLTAGETTAVAGAHAQRAGEGG